MCNNILFYAFQVVRMYFLVYSGQPGGLATMCYPQTIFVTLNGRKRSPFLFMKMFRVRHDPVTGSKRRNLMLRVLNDFLKRVSLLYLEYFISMGRTETNIELSYSYNVLKYMKNTLVMIFSTCICVMR